MLGGAGNDCRIEYGGDAMEMQHIRYDVEDRVGVITLDRPEKANAQNARLLNELDHAWDLAARDKAVRVIVLRANGKHFSAGHDLRPSDDGGPDAGVELVDGKWTVEALYNWESRIYLGYALKWRDVPKPSIAAVQGQCIAGGLLLCWPCDLIVAADNARFSDPVVQMGIGGVEFHAHAWELGPRKAKEILFTGRAMTAEEAASVGMVNKVVALDDLWPETMALARRIAQMHPFGLAQAKRAVNQSLDVAGFRAAIQACFDIHHTGHGNAISVSGYPILASLDEMKGKIDH
jgi:enoyl-CoA hydratase/carnithine racemase